MLFFSFNYILHGFYFDFTIIQVGCKKLRCSDNGDALK